MASGAPGPGEGPEAAPEAEGAQTPEAGQQEAQAGQVTNADLLAEAQQEAATESPSEVEGTILSITSDQEVMASEARAVINAGEEASGKQLERKEIMVNNINQLVIDAQKAGGWDVGPEWYDKYVTQVVGNDAPENVMLGCFQAAFNEHFPVGKDGQRHADDEARALGAVPLGAEAKPNETAEVTTKDNVVKVNFPRQQPDNPIEAAEDERDAA